MSLSCGQIGQQDYPSYHSYPLSGCTSVWAEDRVQASIDEIALSAPVKELLNPEPDNALENFFVAGIASTLCHYLVQFLSLI